nr:immunoglobulin heavy chain junction region [Macaca mulatta]
CARKEDSLDVR